MCTGLRLIQLQLEQRGSRGREQRSEVMQSLTGKDQDFLVYPDKLVAASHLFHLSKVPLALDSQLHSPVTKGAPRGSHRVCSAVCKPPSRLLLSALRIFLLRVFLPHTRNTLCLTPYSLPYSFNS